MSKGFRNDVVNVARQESFIKFYEVDVLSEFSQNGGAYAKNKMVSVDFNVSKQTVEVVQFRKGAVVEDFKDVMDKIKSRFSFLQVG